MTHTEEVRMMQRRLKAAANRASYPHVRRRCREIGNWLARSRRMSPAHVERPDVAYFLRDWRNAIDMECRSAAK